MKRKNAPQITNTRWFPKILTTCIYEFMTWFVNKVNAAKPFLPVVHEGLTYSNKIVVIEKKAGAGFETLDPLIDQSIPRSFINQNDIGQEGLYLMVNSFHQFNPIEAKKILKKIVEIKQPIVILEGNNDSLWQVFGMTVIVPLTVVLTAPFVKPFRAVRLLCTYLFPILPIVTFLDGFMALFKLYNPNDLDELILDLKSDNYQWRSGKMDNGRGGKIIYLIGHPVHKS